MSPQLPNYLRANRKRLGLSQEEIAFLLGALNGAKVCRYERFVRQPSLETALACEVIFQKSIRELFLGLYKEIERDVIERARVLAHKTGRRPSSPQTLQKCQALGMIASNHLKHKRS
jgi:transcriptional regulator with XRE-family HTH domain